MFKEIKPIKLTYWLWFRLLFVKQQYIDSTYEEKGVYVKARYYYKVLNGCIYFTHKKILSRNIFSPRITDMWAKANLEKIKQQSIWMED